MLGIARGTLSDLVALAASKTQRGAASSLRDAPCFRPSSRAWKLGFGLPVPIICRR